MDRFPCLEVDYRDFKTFSPLTGWLQGPHLFTFLGLIGLNERSRNNFIVSSQSTAFRELMYDARPCGRT